MLLRVDKICNSKCTMIFKKTRNLKFGLLWFLRFSKKPIMRIMAVSLARNALHLQPVVSIAVIHA